MVAPPLFNLVQVSVRNGNMDKHAVLYIKQGRKVLELRSRYTTSFMGHFRHEFEATLWSGPALRSGSLLMRQIYQVKLTGEHLGRLPTDEELQLLNVYTSEEPQNSQDHRAQVQAHRDRVVAASRFTFDEFMAARRGRALEEHHP